MPRRKIAPEFNCALVTGASSGIGAELARQIAPHCRRLVIAARRAERLAAIAAELMLSAPDCEVLCEPLDLADEPDRVRFVETLAARGLSPDLLINNAGLGDHGDIATAEWPRLRRMIDVNILGLLHLTWLLLPAMIRARRGLVVNISSIASLIPVPEIGVYAATKAFVTSFSEALRVELDGTGVGVTCICPGPIRTEFGEVAKRPGADGPIKNPAFMMVPLEAAVADMVAVIRARKARFIPGLIPRLVMAFATALPMPLLRATLRAGYRARKNRPLAGAGDK